MTRTVTFTGAAGPGDTVTALVLNNVSNIDFDLAAMIVSIDYDNGEGPKTFKGSLTGVTVTTFTYSGSDVAIVIS